MHLDSRASCAHLAGMRYALAATIALFAFCLPAAGDTLPPIVAKSVSEARASCEGEPTKIEPGFMQRKDVNGDGLPDYILNYEAVSCPTGGHINCGSAGCLTEVFVSSPNGYTKALGENVQQLTFRVIRGQPAMTLGLHGSACGKAGVETCKAVLYWNGDKFTPAH